MNEPHINPATYMLIDKITGEEVDLDIFIHEIKGIYWEKAYAKTLGEYIDVTGSKPVSVIAWVIKNKTSHNLINGTMKEIAGHCEVSERTVLRVFNQLIDKKFVKKVRNGCYLLNPKVMVHGSKMRGAMILRLWGELKL